VSAPTAQAEVVRPTGRYAGEAPPPRTFAAAWAILRRDLTLELRTRESVPAMVLFSVTVFVLFHFGLNRSELDGALASGVLWVTLLLAAVLGVNRLFAAERDSRAFDGILLAPLDRTAVYLAKAAILFVYLAVVEVVAVPAFALLLLGPSVLPELPALIATLALTDLGIAAVGTLVAGLAATARARELIVPLALLPLLVPLLIAAANASAPLLAVHPHVHELPKWLGFTGLYDMVFLLLAVGVFDFLLEE
jgi:heme exporter protein B